MPVFWPTFPFIERAALPIVCAAPEVVSQANPQVQDDRVTITIDKDLTVRAKVVSFDPETSVYTFADGVEATYDVTTVRSQRLEVHMAEGESWAHASGSVEVLDPDAHMTAEDLEFSWNPTNRWAKATRVSIQVGHAHVKAASADLKPLRWEFGGVEATNCPEYYWIHSNRVVVVPGQAGKIEDPTLYAFGHRLFSLPDRRFNLNPRTQGVGLPAVSYRRGQGFGIAWEAGFLLDPNTNLFVAAGAFPHAYPSLGVTATRSLVPFERSSSIITPASDLSERFRFGYLDNIEVRRPVDEARYLQTERNSVSVDSTWNQGVSGLNFDTVVSKAAEVVYERGGGGKIGYLGQARLQTIRERGKPFSTRGVLVGSVELPSVSLAPGLATLSRVDGEQFIGPQQYGWVRGVAGLTFRMNPHVTLSGGAYAAAEHGTPQFQFDKLIEHRGFEVRADLDLGPTKISYLTKYDSRLKWFDREYTVSQIAGCVEPFLLYRQFPSTYMLGVRFRLDEFYDLLSRRQFRRSGNRTVISAPHDHQPPPPRP